MATHWYILPNYLFLQTSNYARQFLNMTFVRCVEIQVSRYQMWVYQIWTIILVHYWHKQLQLTIVQFFSSYDCLLITDISIIAFSPFCSFFKHLERAFSSASYLEFWKDFVRMTCTKWNEVLCLFWNHRREKTVLQLV